MFPAHPSGFSAGFQPIGCCFGFSTVVEAWWGHLTSLPLDDRDRMPVLGDSRASVAGDYISIPVVSAVYLGGMSLAERPYMVSRTPVTD